MKRPYYLGLTSAGMESGVLAQAPFKLEPHPKWSPLFRGSTRISPKASPIFSYPQSHPPSDDGREGTVIYNRLMRQAK